jgi:hypothetical protein
MSMRKLVRRDRRKHGVDAEIARLALDATVSTTLEENAALAAGSGGLISDEGSESDDSQAF